MRHRRSHSTTRRTAAGLAAAAPWRPRRPWPPAAPAPPRAAAPPAPAARTPPSSSPTWPRSAARTPPSARPTWCPATAPPQAIDNAGGVLGHKLSCKGVDTRGDPADAVPATRQMFATTPNLALVIGVTSDEAASVVPVINADKMVVFGMTGQSEFDSTHFQYFYRLVPPDLEESYAMVVIAQQLGYKRIALAFGNDIGSQTFIKPAISVDRQGGPDAGGERDAGPVRVHVPHRGRQDRRRAPGRDLHRGARPDRRDVPVRGQAAQRRQDDPGHRHVGDDLPGLVQVGGRGDRRVHAGEQLPRRQPGHRDQRAVVHPVPAARSCRRRARSAAPATSPPT